MRSDGDRAVRHGQVDVTALINEIHPKAEQTEGDLRPSDEGLVGLEPRKADGDLGVRPLVEFELRIA